MGLQGGISRDTQTCFTSIKAHTAILHNQTDLISNECSFSSILVISGLIPDFFGIN